MKNIYLVLLLAFHSFFASSQGIWNTKSSLPASQRANGFAFSIGDTGYVFAGNYLATSLTDLWAYIPATDTWIQRSSPAFTARFGFTFVLNGKAYVGTGISTAVNNEVWEYDPSSDQWTQKNNFPGGARYGSFSFVIGNTGYIGSGYNPMSSPATIYHDVWAYDAVTDSWTQKANTSVPEYYGFSSFVINSNAVVVGGFGTGSPQTVPANKVWMYDPLMDQWTQKNNFPVTIGLATGFETGNEGYIATGAEQLGSNQIKLNTVYKYNSITDSWSLQAPFPGAGRSGMQAFVINGHVYAGTGLGLASAYYNDWYEYVPSSTTSLQETALQRVWKVYPNPVSEILYIEGNHSDAFITDVYGRLVATLKGSNAIDVSLYPEGIYILNAGTRTSEKFWVKH